MDKKGDSTTILIWVIGIVILLSFAGYNVKDIFSAKEVQQQQVQQQISEALCPVGSDPSNTMTVGPIKRKWSPTTSMSTINARVFEVSKKADGTYDNFKASNDMGSKTDSTTMTVGAEDKLGIIYAYDGGNAVNYYGRWVEITAPCKPFATGSYDAGRNEVVQNASSGLTISVKNSDTGLMQDFIGGQNETIGAGEYGYFDFTNVQTVEKEGISAGTDKDGNIGKVIITVEMNGTLYKEEETTFGNLATASVPSFYTLTGTGSKVKAFSANGCPDPKQDSVKFCQEKWGILTVHADSSQDPIGGASSGGTDSTAIVNGCLKVCIYDQDWYLDTKTGEPKFGFELDDGTAAGKYVTGVCRTLDVT